MNDELHEKTRALLREAITSFEMLDIVLLMRGEPTVTWTTRSMADRVNVPEELVARALQELDAAGLVVACGAPSNPQFQYRPARPELSAAADALAADFAEHRVAVLSAMSTNAIERLRSGALTAFSDAFVLGRKPKADR